MNNIYNGGSDNVDRQCAENLVQCIHNDTRSVQDMNEMLKGMSTKEVAEVLGVSDRTVRTLCKNKEITHYRIGTKIVITESDLQNYIESLKVEKENKENDSIRDKNI